MEKLSREEMLVALSAASEPADKGLSSRQIDGSLLSFCASCPDPVRAMDLVLEGPVGSTTEAVLEQALALPERAVESWSESELAMDHPLRRTTFSS
jgi:hypothetical protein